MTRPDEAWKSSTLTQTYLDGVRGAIPLAAEQIDVLVRLVRAARPSLDCVLDLGCGDGILGRAVLDAYPGARVVFVDFSEAMIAAAKDKVGPKVGPDAGRHAFFALDYATPDWVETVQPFAPVGAVISGFSIHHQPDARKREVYAEIYDLLEPGGIFLNLEHVASATPWLETRFAEHFQDALYAFHQRNGSPKTRQQLADEYYNRPDKVANLLAPVEDQCAWLRELGFTHVDCYLKIFELALLGGVKPE